MISYDTINKLVIGKEIRTYSGAIACIIECVASANISTRLPVIYITVYHNATTEFLSEYELVSRLVENYPNWRLE